MTTPGSPPLAPRQSDPWKPRGGRRLRLILGIVLAVLVAIGGWTILLRPKSSGLGGPKATSSPTTSTSTTPTPTPTSDPQASNDLDTAFRAIHAKHTRAIVERRPEMIDQIYRQDCECYELKSIIEEGVRKGGHHQGYQPEVLLVRTLKEGYVSGPNLGNIRVVTEQRPYTIVNDNGRVVVNDPGWAPQSSYWRLVRARPGSPWMVEFLGVEGAAEKVLGPGWRNGQ